MYYKWGWEVFYVNLWLSECDPYLERNYLPALLLNK